MPVIIAYDSWKGGTGKTTLAVNVAQLATEAGLRVRLYDFDPQGGALRYLGARASASPNLPRIEAVRADIDAKAAEHLGHQAQTGEYDLLICDMPGADSYMAGQIITQTHHVFIPISPAPADILITAQQIHQGIRNDWNMALVPNNLPTSKKRCDQMVQTLTGMGVPIAPVGLHRRVAYWDAVSYGQGVCEIQPRSPAAFEMRSLWDWTSETIGLLAGAPEYIEVEARYG